MCDPPSKLRNSETQGSITLCSYIFLNLFQFLYQFHYLKGKRFFFFDWQRWATTDVLSALIIFENFPPSTFLFHTPCLLNLGKCSSLDIPSWKNCPMFNRYWQIIVGTPLLVKGGRGRGGRTFQKLSHLVGGFTFTVWGKVRFLLLLFGPSVI